jgi:hypothetical protein
MKLSKVARAIFAAEQLDVARAYGSIGGKIGGKIAAANMTPEQRIARARKAGLARKAKPK